MRAKLLESGNVLLDTGNGMMVLDPSHDSYLTVRQRLAKAHYSRADANQHAPTALSENSQKAVENYRRLISDLLKIKDETFTSPDAVLRFVDSIAQRVTHGLVKPEALHRTEDSSNFTDVADLPDARKQFADELYNRLNDPKDDPIDTAAWVNWRLNLTDHFYSDGNGKVAEALGEFVLMRAGLPLLEYRDHKEAFAKFPREKFSPAAGGRSYVHNTAYAKWQAHYRSHFPNDLDARVAKHYAWNENDHPRGQPGNAGQFGSGGASAQATESQPPSKRMAPWLRHRDDYLFDAFKSAKKDTDVEVKLKKKVAAELSSRMAKMGVTADAAKAFTAALPDDEEFSQDPIENAAAHLVSSWATTSNDHDHLARAIQETCAKVFGITNHYPLAQSWNPDNESLTEKGAKKIIDKHAPVLEAFLKSTYEATQEHFKDLGMTHVAVYRGMSIAPVEKQQIKTDEEMQLQPMSSFSAAYETARGFGLTASSKESSAMIAATIPVERVISTCFSGPGCLSEDELVVLGGVAHCTVGYFPRTGNQGVATIPHEEDQFLKLLEEQKS